MKSYSYGRVLVAVSVLLCASQSARAFFCFNFAFGTDDNDHYRRLPPIAPPARYAPHPSHYLLESHQFSAPANLPPGRYAFRPFPASPFQPAATYLKP